MRTTKTKITYDYQTGIIVKGEDATTADIKEVSGKKFNVTHTGEVTGASILTLDKTAITNKPLVTVSGLDHVLIADASDGGNLKKVLASDLAGGGGGGANLTWDAPTRTVLSDSGTDAVITLADGTNAGLMTSGQFNKLGFITITQAVDLDVIESDTVLNNAKVTNATHTGEVTGATALTLDKTSITNRSAVTPVGGDYLLISDVSDSNNLKKVLISDLPSSPGTTNLSWDAPTRTIASDTGSDAVISLADTINAGLLSSALYDKLSFITITQAVDLDVLESDTVLNNAKVTNATHTGEVTGSGALTLDKTAITNRSTVSVDNADFILISDTSDSDNLKKVAVSDIRPVGLSIKEVEINFGTTPTIDKAFVITDAAIGALSKIVILPSGSLATGQVGVDFAVEAVQFVATPDVGQFTIYALSLNGYLTGSRKVFYIHN